MQAKLGDGATILGVDAIGQEPTVSLLTDTIDLPWLQDAAAAASARAAIHRGWSETSGRVHQR